MHACSAGDAGETAPLWGPPVVFVLPGLRALQDEVFLSLFCVLAWLPFSFVVQVVLFVLEDLLKPLCSLEVDGFMVLVQGLLPSGLSSVMERICPAPRQLVQHLVAFVGAEVHFQELLVFWCFCVCTGR